LIDSEGYLLTCYRYIELNPVRAAMVDHSSQYPWSSYHYKAMGVVDEIISPHEQYRQLSKTSQARQASYRALFKARILDKTLVQIRDATNKAWVLGSEPFKEAIEMQLNRRVRPATRGETGSR
jgi:putative transposase